eukprot:scaffold1189_cov194-Amphora_coffeaeformis.AAC.10
MPAVGSIKDRLRVFEPQSETVAPEPPIKNVRPKTRAVANQYTQNLSIQKLTPSPRWKQTMTPKSMAPKARFDSREETEETRPSSASSEVRWGSDERQNNDAVEAEKHEVPIAAESPRKAFAAYKALIQKNNKHSSPFEKRSSPAPSPARASTEEHQGTESSTGFRKPFFTTSGLRRVGSPRVIQKPSSSAGDQKAVVHPGFHKTGQNSREDVVSDSPAQETKTTTPTKSSRQSNARVYALPSPTLKTLTPTGFRRNTTPEKKQNSTSGTNSEDQGRADSSNEPPAQPTPTKLAKYRFPSSPGQVQNSASIEKGSPGPSTVVFQKHHTPTNESKKHEKLIESPQIIPRRFNLRKVASPVRSMTPTKDVMHNEPQIVETSKTSSPVMFPLFPAGSRASIENTINTQGIRPTRVIPQRTRSKSPMVAKKLATKHDPTAQETPDQVVPSANSTDTKTLPTASQSLYEHDTPLKSQPSADGSTTSKRSRSRLLEVRQRSPALFKAFSLELKRSVDITTSALEHEKSTFVGSIETTKSSASDEELGDIARRTAGASDRHPNVEKQGKPSPLSQMKAFNRLRNLSKEGLSQKDTNKGTGNQSQSVSSRKQGVEVLGPLSGASAFRPAKRAESAPKSTTTVSDVERKKPETTPSPRTFNQEAKSEGSTLSSAKSSKSKTQTTKVDQDVPDENANSIETTLSGRMSRADRYAAMLKQKNRAAPSNSKHSSKKEGSKPGPKADFDASFGFVSRFNEQVSTRLQNPTNVANDKIIWPYQGSRAGKEELPGMPWGDSPAAQKEAFEAGCRILNARKMKTTGESRTQEFPSNPTQASSPNKFTPNSFNNQKRNAQSTHDESKKEIYLPGTGANPIVNYPTINRSSLTQGGAFKQNRKSDLSCKPETPQNRFQRGRVSDVSAHSDATFASKEKKAFKYQALDSPGDDSFKDWDVHGKKEQSPMIAEATQEDFEATKSTGSWLNRDFHGEWAMADEQLSETDKQISVFSDAFPDGSEDFEAPSVGQPPDIDSSFGSLTDDADEDTSFPVNTMLPVQRRSIDVGDHKPASSPRSSRSPVTPSRFHDVRSIFENAAKSSNALPTPPKKIAMPRREIEGKETASNTKSEVANQRVGNCKEPLQEVSKTRMEDDNDSWAPQAPPRENEIRATQRDGWKASPWGNISVEEKVMSSIERLYNTNITQSEQAKIVEDAMNPFSLSTEFTSQSFPSTFDETAMDTDPLDGGFFDDVPVLHTAEDPSSSISSLQGTSKGANQSISRSIDQSGTSDIENSMLHGELLTEDGSGLHFSSGSKSLKMSSQEDSARLSSGTGNFLSSSSSQMSKSTVSREELLKARTRSTVSSSTDIERLAPITDVIKEEEQGISQDESVDARGDTKECDQVGKPAVLLTTSPASQNTKQSKSDTNFDPNSKSDTLRWWQKKYAQKVGGQTNSAVTKAFNRKGDFTRVDSYKDDEDVFSGLEEDPKTQNTSFEKAVNETVSNEEDPNGDSQRLQDQDGSTFKKKVGTIVEVSESEVSDDAKATEVGKCIDPNSHSGKLIDRYDMNQVTSDITFSVAEGRDRRKIFKMKEVFGKIDEASEHQSHPGSQDDTYSDMRQETSSRIEENSRFDSPSRMESQISKMESQSQLFGSRLESNVESQSRLSQGDSRSCLVSPYKTRRDSHSHDRPRGNNKLTASTSNSIEARTTEDTEETVNDDDDVDAEDMDADTLDISYAESKEQPSQSAVEFTAAAVLSLGYAIADSFAKACKIGENFPHMSNCTHNTAASCSRKGEDCAVMLGLDDATDDPVLQAQSRASVSPIMELNDAERKLWDRWEERDDLSGRKEKIIQDESKETKREKSEVKSESTSSNEPSRACRSSTSSMDSSMNRLNTARRREAAQSMLLDHSEKAQALNREQVQSILSSKTEDTDVLSTEDNKSTATGKTGITEIQQDVLQKFSTLLRNDKVEVLKLNRHGKWQLRYITVSREVAWLKTVGVPSTPKSSQCPQALLWYKAHNTKNAGLAGLKNDGRGGFLFSQLHTVERDPNVNPPTAIPKKLKAKFRSYAGVKIGYHCDEGERDLVFCFQDQSDAKAFCTAVKIIHQVVLRSADNTVS